MPGMALLVYKKGVTKEGKEIIGREEDGIKSAVVDVRKMQTIEFLKGRGI